MQYDTNSIMGEISFSDFVDICINELNYEVNPNGSLNSGKINCICHYHNDGKHANKRFGSTSLISKGSYKGIYCFACGASKSLIQMVMDEKDMHIWEAIDFICEKASLSKQDYAIPGTESDWDLKNSIKSQKNSPLDEIFPDALNKEQLKLIGLYNENYMSDTHNYEVIYCYDEYNKPSVWELEKGEFLIEKDIPNPKYIKGSLSEYSSFLDYVAGNKTIGGSEEYPFQKQYLLARKVSGYTLSEMYKNDKPAYWRLISSKCTKAILEKEEMMKTTTKFIQYNLQKQLKILYKIFNDYVKDDVVNMIQSYES